jgi:hypothetical protein
MSRQIIMAESKNPYRSVKRQKKTEASEQYELPGWLYDEEGNPDPELEAEYSTRRDALIEQIRAAFSRVKFKGNVVTTDGDLYQKEDINRAFRNRRWEEITLDDLALYGWEIPWTFQVEAIHYYLPAFMIAILLFPDTTDRVQSALSIDPDHLWRPKLIALFSLEQKQAVLDFYQFQKFAFQDNDIRINQIIKFWEAQL